MHNIQTAPITHAEAMYSVRQYGEYLGSDCGSLKSRLQFSETDSSMSVYVEVIGNSLFDRIKSFILSKMNHKFIKYIRTKEKDGVSTEETIFINVKSLAKRIEIPEDDILANPSNKKLFDRVVNTACQRRSEINKSADTLFQKIIKNNYDENDGVLYSKHSTAQIEKKQLQGLVRFAESQKHLILNQQPIPINSKGQMLLLLENDIMHNKDFNSNIDPDIQIIHLEKKKTCPSSALYTFQDGVNWSTGKRVQVRVQVVEQSIANNYSPIITDNTGHITTNVETVNLPKNNNINI